MIAIIPARGGSKRIPRKNLKDFAGKPIIAYSIKAALESNLFDEVMVSTDDVEIAETALIYGAKVPFYRSAKNADDFATTVDVLLEVISAYRSNLGLSYDIGCCIYPTAPFVTPNKLRQAHDYLIRNDFDTVFPVLPFGYPVQRALKMAREKITMVNEEFIDSRSQDLETFYHDSGQFYWFQMKALLAKERMFTDNSGAILISELEAQDIDSEIDWKLAELKYKLTNNKI